MSTSVSHIVWREINQCEFQLMVSVVSRHRVVWKQMTVMHSHHLWSPPPPSSSVFVCFIRFSEHTIVIYVTQSRWCWEKRHYVNLTVFNKTLTVQYFLHFNLHSFIGNQIEYLINVSGLISLSRIWKPLWKRLQSLIFRKICLLIIKILVDSLL